MSGNARPKLGRGLNSLIPPHATSSESFKASAADVSGISTVVTSEKNALPGVTVVNVDINHIDRNPSQPRDAIDESSLRELAKSIGQHGVLQPLLLRPVNGRYQLIAGHRRLQAARLSGLNFVPAIVHTNSNEASQAE